jgi:hypothetical protein
MALSVSDFDPNHITFNFFKSKDNSQKKIYLNYGNTRDAVRIQLCSSDPGNMLRTPFGISEPMAGAADNGRKSMEVAIDDNELGSKLRTLETNLKKYMLEHSAAIFGRELSIELIEEKFCSPFREFEEAGKSNLLRTKIPESCEILAMHEVDTETKRVKVHAGSQSDVTRNGRCVPSVEISAVWFVARDSQAGYSLTVTNLIVDTSKQNRQGSQGVKAFIMPPGWEMSMEDTDSLPTNVPDTSAGDMGLDFETSPRPAKLAKVESQMNDDPAAYL